MFSPVYDYFQRVMYSTTGSQEAIATAIASLEDALSGMRQTEFHALLNRDFLHMTDATAVYLAAFWTNQSVIAPLTRIYCEMEEFAFNTEIWSFHALGYRSTEEMNALLRNGNWVGDYVCDADEDVMLTGMDPVQEAFERWTRQPSRLLFLDIVWDLSFLLVILKFNQLITVAHRQAAELVPGIASIPVFSGGHDMGIVFPSVIAPSQ